jgi:ppGpp synthetase/RelA/SpoT-type nucleotidyltranferase
MDLHCQAILQEYRDNLPLLNKTADEVRASLRKAMDEAGLIIAALECRVKTEHSLAGKLELKGSKYASLGDLTDIIGLRVITFYIDDVDKVASAVERLFTVDWDNSVDKRKLHDIDSFGYLSLHYICSTPGCPYRFEIQMRTVLQHAWANMNHDTGYKSGVEIPTRYRRDMSRIAGMLELIDDEFSRIRTEINDYRRRVQALVASGNLADVALDGDSFRSFLAIEPFKNLNRKIAAVNQAEIQDVSLLQFLPVFKGMGFKTLGDIENLIKQYSEAAYQIATFQIGLTDIDIVSSSIGPQDLCIAYIIKSGWGKAGLKLMLDALNGPSESNESMAEFLEEETKGLPFMNQ